MRRPTFHYRPAQNWINDPNGLCQMKGWYHLFYQYNPGGSMWGDMHWGHARSKDMLSWETMPVAMAPLRSAGEEHCFSGCCCMDGQGKPHIFYTSIGRDEDGRGARDGAEQWTAEPTDERMTRLQQHSSGALTDAIHGGIHVADWRDPYVVPYGDGYMMVLGGCVEGRGCVLLYTSPDMTSWHWQGIIAQAETADNVPWECPNLFPLGDQWVLLYSPCAAPRYQVGTLDEAMHFHMEKEGVLDAGGQQGFYAPQAFRDASGRTLLMGWMPEGDGEGAILKGWSGVMSLPRLLTLDASGDLTAAPLTEALEQGSIAVRRRVTGKALLTRHGRRMLLRAETRLMPGQSLTLQLGCDPHQGEESLLTLNASGRLSWMPQKGAEIGGEKTSISRDVPLQDGHASIFLAVDDSMVECAVNGRWLSARMYPSDTAGEAYITTDACCDITVWDEIKGCRIV